MYFSIEPPSDEILNTGETFTSPGGSYVYEISGPVCILYDREQLPYPSCSISWKGKQPSWKRVGCRFVVDMATRRCPCYAANLKGFDGIVYLPIYWMLLTPAMRTWWYTPRSEKLATFWSTSQKQLTYA